MTSSHHQAAIDASAELDRRFPAGSVIIAGGKLAVVWDWAPPASTPHVWVRFHGFDPIDGSPNRALFNPALCAPATGLSRQEAHDLLVAANYLPEPGSSRYVHPHGGVGRIVDELGDFFAVELSEK